MKSLRLISPSRSPLQFNAGEVIFAGCAGPELIALRIRLGRRILPIPLLSNGDFRYRLSMGRGLKLVRLEGQTEAGWQRLRQWLFRASRAGNPHSLREYHRWIAQCEKPLKLGGQSGIEQVREAPVFSIITPLYNTPVKLWQEAAESVLGQDYPHWQWCLADDCSPRREVAEAAQRLAERDSRIRFVQLDSNGHISKASNAAANLASGSHLTFLDHDDVLAGDALTHVARHLRESPHQRWVYSDEDKLDANGQRKGPYFKPDWNPDLLRAQNYVCHLSTVEADLFRRAGSFREGLEGSQDHDLFLRLSEILKPEEIGHIPRILYHWRETEGSTATGPEAKSYTFEAAHRALSEHLQRSGIADAVIERSALLYWNICYRNLLGQPLLLEQKPVPGQTASWARAINREVGQSTARWFILNWQGVRLEPAAIERLGGALSRSESGCAGGMILSNDGSCQTILSAGAVLHPQGIHYPFRGCGPEHGGMGLRSRVQQNYTVPGTGFLACRRETFLQVGGLAEKDWHPQWIAAGLCLRLREAGFWNFYDPAVTAHSHSFPLTREGGPPAELLEQFLPWFERDPAFNPNLTLMAAEMVWG